LVRQIKKLKKDMAEQPEKKRKKLEAELREKRVLLNYVLVSIESDAICWRVITKDE
jgi:transcription antitermination factor NusG